MKKITLLSIATLALSGIAELAASTWNITNQLDRPVCVTVNTGVSRIRRYIEVGERKTIVSKACLYSISVKEGMVEDKNAEGVIEKISLKSDDEVGRCPLGLENIGKTTIFEIDQASFDKLKQIGLDQLASLKTTKQKPEQETPQTKNTAQKQPSFGQALQQVGATIFGTIQKACSNRDFEITTSNGAVVVVTPKQ